MSRSNRCPTSSGTGSNPRISHCPTKHGSHSPTTGQADGGLPVPCGSVTCPSSHSPRALLHRKEFLCFTECFSLPPPLLCSLLLFPPSRLALLLRYAMGLALPLKVWKCPQPKQEELGWLQRTQTLAEALKLASFSPSFPAPSQLHPLDSKTPPAGKISSIPDRRAARGSFLSASAWGVRCKTSALKRPSVGRPGKLHFNAIFLKIKTNAKYPGWMTSISNFETKTGSIALIFPLLGSQVLEHSTASTPLLDEAITAGRDSPKGGLRSREKPLQRATWRALQGREQSAAGQAAPRKEQSSSSLTGPGSRGTWKNVGHVTRQGLDPQLPRTLGKKQGVRKWRGGLREAENQEAGSGRSSRRPSTRTAQQARLQTQAWLGLMTCSALVSNASAPPRLRGHWDAWLCRLLY